MTTELVTCNSQITSPFSTEQFGQTTFPNDLIIKIFAYLTTPKDFMSFGGASKHLNQVSWRIPKVLFISDSMRKYFCNRDLLHNPKFNEASEKLIQAYLEQKKAQRHLTEVLKERCEELQLDVNSSNDLPYYDAGSKGFLKLFNSKKLAEETPIQPEMTTLIDRITESCISAMSSSYANQPAEAITIKNFQRKALDIHMFSPIGIVNCETAIRQALVAKHQEAFKALSVEFSDPILSQPKFALVQEQLRTELEAKKATLEKTVAQLRRPRTLDAANMERAGTQSKLEAAEFDVSCRLLLEISSIQTCLKPANLNEATQKKLIQLSRFYYELAKPIHLYDTQTLFNEPHSEDVLG
jgi:hypothetical protein